MTSGRVCGCGRCRYGRPFLCPVQHSWPTFSDPAALSASDPNLVRFVSAGVTIVRPFASFTSLVCVSAKNDWSLVARKCSSMVSI